jgi:hypothetical protein
VDFVNISIVSHGERAKNKYTIEPEFRYISKDLITKGGVVHGFWYEGKWRTELSDLIQIIDNQIMNYAKDFKNDHKSDSVELKLMNNHSSAVMTNFKKYTQQTPDSDVEFNTRIIFSNETPTREDYSTTQLSYYPSEGSTKAFDEMFTLLYEPEELDKILWFMGALLTNNMRKIQKFLFLYGGKGSGKGTILKIFKMMFEGYHNGIDLHKLTSGSEFSTAGVKETQLLIDDDSDISAIKDDTNLLKLTSHEPIMVNNKYQSTYPVTFKGLLVAASNQRFKVRNIDSGIVRRGVVAEPTNQKHKPEDYDRLMELIKFEIPAIAHKAIMTFSSMGPSYYESYVPYEMMESTDLFYSFMRESANALGDKCTLKTASELYKSYLLDFDYDTSGFKKKAKLELNRYYREYHEQKREGDLVLRNVYEGLKWDDIFPEKRLSSKKLDKTNSDMLDDLGFGNYESEFDIVARTYPAQYTNSDGNPKIKWDDVSSTLSDIDTKELHFVRLPLIHIVADFDLKNERGEKDLLLNLREIQKFPETYAELSKSGQGIHLHYIYDGDVDKLASLYSDNIEIKVFKGKSSLRRKLTLCNNKPIAHLSAGLPEKEEKLEVYKDIKVINWNEQKMRSAIKGNLEKKYHESTKSSIDFIVKIFDDAGRDGIKYDLKDMRQDVLKFAASSSNQAEYCIKAVSKINFCTIENEDADDIQRSSGSSKIEKEDLYFYDIEVFPNLFIICFKKYGIPEITSWINPTKEQVAWLVEKPLVGFNNRRYDNHIIYSALCGADNLELYRQSQRIINDKNAGSGMNRSAYELSYTDIYDYCNAGNKKSLKKWEVELGIKHLEFELPWDQPVPEDKWEEAADYCANDVSATEEVFNATKSDFNARLILSALSGLSPNATTNQHTTAIIFEGDRKIDTDKELVYTDLSEMFPGYSYSFGKSSYRGEDPGEGGCVYAEPGVYIDVALLDVESMHPTSAIEMNMFGKHTKNYEDIKQARIEIKHGNYEAAAELFGGKLKPFLTDPESATALSDGLKTAINSVYGLTSAGFDNQFKHKKNVDNIVAKRGALFMIDLKHAVQERGYTVAHIKTDSIKIPNADKFIIDFVFDFGRKYGYKFVHEATYSRLALVNKSTYISQVGWSPKEKKIGTWSATGAQFQEPYVFKTLFSKEALEVKDFFLSKEVKDAAIYLGDKFIGRIAEIYASNSGEEMFRVKEEKRGAITGTKGHRWKLSKDWTSYKDVDMVFYKKLVTDAIGSIKAVGDASIMIDDLENLDTDEDELPVEWFDTPPVENRPNVWTDENGKTIIDVSDEDLPF